MGGEIAKSSTVRLLFINGSNIISVRDYSFSFLEFFLCCYFSSLVGVLRKEETPLESAE